MRSTDNTAEVVSHISDRLFKYISGSDKGILSVLSEGIKSNGDHIARMDADDILIGNRLSSQIDFLNNNKDHGLVGRSKLRTSTGRYWIGLKPHAILGKQKWDYYIKISLPIQQ